MSGKTMPLITQKVGTFRIFWTTTFWLQEIICHLRGVLDSYIDKVVESRQRRNRRRFRKIRVELPDKPTIVRGNWSAVFRLAACVAGFSKSFWSLRKQFCHSVLVLFNLPVLWEWFCILYHTFGIPYVDLLALFTIALLY